MRFFDLIEKFVYRLQNSEDNVDSIIFGLILFLIGLGLCFLGAFLIKVFLTICCIFAIDLLLIEIALFIVQEGQET